MYDMYKPHPNPTLRLGLLLGIAAGSLDSLGNLLLVVHVHVSDSTQAALSVIGFLAILAGPFVSGLMTARDRGTIQSGALTGLLTGLVGSLTSGIVGILVLAIDPNVPMQAIGISVPGPFQQQYSQGFIGGMLPGVCFGGVVWMAIGAGLGALGGLTAGMLLRGDGAEIFPANPYRGMAPPPGAYPPRGYPGYHSPPDLAPDKPPDRYMPGAAPFGPPPAPLPPGVYGPPRPGTNGPPPVRYGPPPHGTYGPPPPYPPRPGTSGPAPSPGPFPPPAPPYDEDR